jgi:hypothetical protein
MNQLRFDCCTNIKTGQDDYMTVDERTLGNSGPTARFAVQGSSCRLTPESALLLAIRLMDWARDHMPKITPEMAAFGASYVAPFQQEYTSNPQDWGFDEQEDYNADDVVWPYCQTCGTALVNGVCPEKQAFDDWDHEQRPESIGVWLDDGADDWAVDGANQEWR